MGVLSIKLVERKLFIVLGVLSIKLVERKLRKKLDFFESGIARNESADPDLIETDPQHWLFES